MSTASAADGAWDDGAPQQWPPLPPLPTAEVHRGPTEPWVCCVEAILSAGGRHTEHCPGVGGSS